MSTIRGLRATVLRSAHGDTTNGGITARNDTVFVAVEDEVLAERLMLPTYTGREPLVYIGRDGLGRDVVAYPTESPGGSVGGYTGPMYGGNCIDSSDSRWRDVVGRYGPVRVYDRYETWAQYERLTR